VFTITRNYVQSGKPYHILPNDVVICGIYPVEHLASLQTWLASVEDDNPPANETVTVVAVDANGAIATFDDAVSEPAALLTMFEQLYKQHALTGFALVRVHVSAVEDAKDALRDLHVYRVR
jgi:hypothetical protein